MSQDSACVVCGSAVDKQDLNPEENAPQYCLLHQQREPLRINFGGRREIKYHTAEGVKRYRSVG